MWLFLLAKLKKFVTDLFDNIFPKNIVTVNKNLHFLIMTINDSFSIIFQGVMLV